jgi:hypothetical protein
LEGCSQDLEELEAEGNNKEDEEGGEEEETPPPDHDDGRDGGTNR